MQGLYDWESVKKLIDKYTEMGGEVHELTGSLQDNYICTLAGYKSAVVREVYLNEWSSGLSVRFYNKLPKKYEEVIALLDDGEEDKARERFAA